MADQPHGFRIAIICALPLEYDAVTLAFNELWSEASVPQGTLPEGYSRCKTGRIESHNIILLLLTGIGMISAASAATALRAAHPQLELAVLAGICGGVPSPGTEHEVLLGDVVISKKLIEYDLGRQYPGMFTRKETGDDTLGRPNKKIRSLLTTFSTKLGLKGLQARTTEIMEQLQRTAIEAKRRDYYVRPAYYLRPPAIEDILYEPENLHRHRQSSDCKQKVENFYRHTESPDHCNDDEDGIKSIVSGPEDIQSQDGSGSVRWEVRTAAVSYLAELLINDPNLAPLYVDAAKRLEDDRFFRNHGRLLKRYYLSLRSQSPNQKQKVAIEFLRPRSHRKLISLSVREKVLSYDKTRRDKVHATLPQEDERNLTLERFLNGVETPSHGHSPDSTELSPYYDEDESSSDEEDRESINTLVDLEETRSFFVSGTPLTNFKTELRNFLYPAREGVSRKLEFQLVPVGEATVPNNFRCAEFPPESEVKEGNYLYEPVPMFDVELASIPLWHLTRPGQHSDKYWITTFPKKLRYPLHREPGVYVKPTIGWGIRINEAFNLHHFLFLILLVIVIIGVIMGIYLALTADDSSAFGLAAFLAAASAIYIPYQYFAWKEKLE
ncbi:hypothetical protein QIS74_11516 [Colletotrichum tabaci]|uniref:Nucleoside phosphorylase domain-containing protein n=1 Tax=Colletotrichum tabaci TaxID=1209068 RepID=A0AAV9SYL0_9PEZI